MVFSGSYRGEDVTFLLKPIQIEGTDLLEKERMIQSGARHYSEMISREQPPDETYVRLFLDALARNGERFADDVVHLARHLALKTSEEVVIVSLARAGTPIGVLLKRTLDRLGRRCIHYSISIIRDRGIDTVALDHILARHSHEAIAFVDGWTGKGAIAGELQSSIRDYNDARGTQLVDDLYVLADLAGVASFAATSEDYLIPCAIMNAVVSGLVSRTILNSEYVGLNDFHACLFYDEFADHDRSCWFVDKVMDQIDANLIANSSNINKDWHGKRQQLGEIAAGFVKETMQRYGITDRNRIKPGVGEATRALLRRIPERLLLRDPDLEDVEHLLWLANRRGIAVEHASWLPYNAAAIIRSLGTE